MKFYCGACNVEMTAKDVKDREEEAMDIPYVCPQCSNTFTLKANPMESKVIRELCVRTESGTVPGSPTEFLKELLNKDSAEGQALPWDADAENKLGNIPFFVRKTAKATIEKFAKEKGFDRITLEVMSKAREVYGM